MTSIKGQDTASCPAVMFSSAAKLQAWLNKHTNKSIVLKPDGTIWKTKKLALPKEWKRAGIDQDRYELRVTPIGEMYMYTQLQPQKPQLQSQQHADADAMASAETVDASADARADWEALPLNEIATRLAGEHGASLEVRGNAALSIDDPNVDIFGLSQEDRMSLRDHLFRK